MSPENGGCTQSFSVPGTTGTTSIWAISRIGGELGVRALPGIKQALAHHFAGRGLVEFGIGRGQPAAHGGECGVLLGLMGARRHRKWS